MAEILLYENRSVKTYLVKDSKFGKPVIKKVHVKDQIADSDSLEFKFELELLQSLPYKGIQRGLGIETENGKPALYYDYYDGFSIKQLIKSNQLDLKKTLQIIKGVAEVLATLHEIKLIHKNINSHSILVNTETWEVQIIDFSHANKINNRIGRRTYQRLCLIILKISVNDISDFFMIYTLIFFYSLLHKKLIRKKPS